MKVKKILACVMAVVTLMPILPVIPAFAEDALFSEDYDMTGVQPNDEGVISFEQEVPDGDYTVTVKTGGATATDANIYINGGERVRAYTLEAGATQDNAQPVVPKDGKITVEVKGENPNVTEIDIRQLPTRTEAGEKPTIYIAGDSTAQTYDYTKNYPMTGWGQVFADYFTDDVIVENRAMGGRSLKRFDNDGRLDAILTEMHPGDYVFIQFGINDGAVDKPDRYISVEDYKTLMKEKYVGEIRKRGGIPVILTPTAAAWWDEENEVFTESRQDYAPATIEAAEETDTELLDINGYMTVSWNSLGKDSVFEMYFICEPLESKAYPAGTDDHTHLKALGAKEVAKLIACQVSVSDLDIADYVRTEHSYDDMEGHWAEELISEIDTLNVIDGVDGTSFEPDRTVTRAEFLKMVMESCGIVGHAFREGECGGADGTEWYCCYLQGALDKGLIPETMMGTSKTKATKVLSEATDDAEAVTTEIYDYGSDGDFKGDSEITREEMAALLISGFKYFSDNLQNEDDQDGLFETIKANAGDVNIPDLDKVSDEYRDDVIAAYETDLLDGDEYGYFNPTMPLTRAEAVKAVCGPCWLTFFRRNAKTFNDFDN